MKHRITDLEIRPCNPEDIEAIMDIQEEAFAHLDDKTLLRKNSREMLLDCLCPPHVTLGAWHKDRLVAFSVLYFPGDSSENLARSLVSVKEEDSCSVNYKLCIVRPDYRGLSLQYTLARQNEETAKERGAEIICCTASPHNQHSIRNIEKLGFIYDRTLKKYGLTRNLYYKHL